MIRFDQATQHAQAPNRHPAYVLCSAALDYGVDPVRTLELPAGAAWTVSSFVNTAADLTADGHRTAHVP